MKNTQIYFLILLFVLAFCALCVELSAQPFAEIRLRKHQFNNEVITTVDSIYRFWNNRKDVQATPGTSYTFPIGADTVFYWTPVTGKKIKATITFTEDGVVVPPPTDDTTKIDNLKATKSTTWQHNAATGATGWYKGTSAYSNVAGSTLTFSFTGTKIELWAEKLPSHGRGTVKIDNGTEVPVSFIGTKELPSLIYSSGTLQAVPHTITLKVTSGYCLTDFFVVQNYVPSSGSIPPPTGNIIDIFPGENLKQKIESAPSGSTVRIPDFTFAVPIIDVPEGVNIECGPSTVIACITPGVWVPGAPENGQFNFKSSSPASIPQSVKGCILEGNDLAFAGAVIERRTVKFDGTKFKNFNFTGAWFRFSSDSQVINSEFHNSAWSSDSFLSGAINLFFTTRFTADNIKVTSNKNNKGTAIEALWKKSGALENTLVDTKILNSSFILSHQNPWQGGKSQNFAIELHDTHYRGLEIGYCYTENEFSLASHRIGNGQKNWVHHNTGDLKGDNFFIEAVMDDLHAEHNNIKGAKMFSANMQENSRWKNHRYNNNTFESAGLLAWGAIFLFGKSGISNYLIENNTIKLKGNVLKKWMGTDQSGLTEKNNNVTQ